MVSWIGQNTRLQVYNAQPKTLLQVELPCLCYECQAKASEENGNVAYYAATTDL